MDDKVYGFCGTNKCKRELNNYTELAVPAAHSAKANAYISLDGLKKGIYAISIEGEVAFAPGYTDCTLEIIFENMLNDIAIDTVIIDKWLQSMTFTNDMCSICISTLFNCERDCEKSRLRLIGNTVNSSAPFAINDGFKIKLVRLV